MKAIIRDVYGGPEVLRWGDARAPRLKPQSVLIRVAAASVNAADLRILRGTPALARLAFGLFRPKAKILGADVAGIVEAVGDGVTHFKPGDAVFGDLSGSGLGAYAELAVAPEKMLAAVPAVTTMEQAASMPMAAVTALQALSKKARLKPGEHVLVTGASGGVGSFAVQVAKALGASVTAVTSTPNVEAVRALGADQVIDRNKEDFRGRHGSFDVVIETAGQGKLRDSLKVLTPGGRYVVVGGSDDMTMAAVLSGKSMFAMPNLQDLESVAAMQQAGKIKPLIGATFALAEAAEAMRQFEAGGVPGKIVLVNSPVD